MGHLICLAVTSSLSDSWSWRWGMCWAGSLLPQGGSWAHGPWRDPWWDLQDTDEERASYERCLTWDMNKELVPLACSQNSTALPGGFFVWCSWDQKTLNANSIDLINLRINALSLQILVNVNSEWKAVACLCLPEAEDMETTGCSGDRQYSPLCPYPTCWQRFGLSRGCLSPTVQLRCVSCAVQESHASASDPTLGPRGWDGII